MCLFKDEQMHVIVFDIKHYYSFLPGLILLLEEF